MLTTNSAEKAEGTLHVPVVGNEGELCCTALSSSSSLSSSDRLLPMAEVMAAVDESTDFCLFGKLKRRQTGTTANSSYRWKKRRTTHTTFQACDRIPVDVVLFNVRQRRAATVPGPGALLG